jgi:chemotaxis protein methyltransferase CheR
MADPTPSPQVVALFAALVEERVGLCYRLAERPILAEKLLAHMQQVGFDSLLDYYYFLRYDDPGHEETKRLIEALLVHETYFFRELEPLEVAIDHVVVPAVRRGGRARVWSAACATGEEAVSLAVLLAERELLDRCEIVASDVSEAVLEHARRGRYRRRSVRGDGPQLAARWLERDGDELVVAPQLLDAIELRRVNLCNPAEVASQGTFDLVVCRHVLIYFADPTIVAVVASLADRLREGGALLVGISESLARFSTRVVGEERAGTFLYRRAS